VRGRRRSAGWRWVALASVLAAALVGAAGAAGAARAPAARGGSGSDPAAESLVNLAAEASVSGGYAGTASVKVNGQGGTRSGELRVVHPDAGHLLIEAPDPPGPASGSRLVQAGQSRSVTQVPAGSVSRGQAPLAGDVEPDANLRQMLGKYRVLLEGGVRVLERDAEVVRIERIADGRLVERWTIEAATGLLLRRETYDARGMVERSTVFTAIEEPYASTVDDIQPPPEADASQAAPQQWFTAGELSRQAKALGVPEALPAGYRLESGTTFRAGPAPVVQLVYSDGLEDVSLFAQPGRMARSGLPASARDVRLVRGAGLRWEGFPRGVAWQDGPTTLTLVGASPADELTQMANALPQAPLQRSPRQRLGHLVRWLREGLPW
jgi:MucB/RseB N-terminal domain